MAATNRTYNRQAERTYSGIMPKFWDHLVVAYPNSTTEEYSFSVKTELSDDSSPVYQLMAIIQVVYTDDTKNFLSTVSKTYSYPEIE